MSRVHKTVFINYRRETSGFAALYVYEHLKNHGYDVFLDVKNMNPGHFDTTIRNQIRARAHFLAILSPGSLKDRADPGDWVRYEIELAIKHQRNIVPLMTGGFKFEDYQEQLTGLLSELERYAGLNMLIEFVDAAMEALKRFLDQPVQVTIHPVPPADQLVVQRKLEIAAEQPTPTESQLTAEEILLSGLKKQEAGDLEKAITYYNKAIQHNPQYARAYNNRGTVHYYQNDLRAAISDYDKAIQLDSEYAMAYSNRGHARYHQNDLDEAIADITKAIQLSPQYADAYINRGEAYFAKQQYESGLADFKRALKLSPKDKWGIAGQAVALHALGRVDEAREQWRELIVQDTRFRDADWIGEELEWHPALIEEARKLIESL